MPVTIIDIAKKLNVSHSTVSRALNGSTLISHDTTERIRKIAAEMGYLHSAAARSLKTNRSQALGVIVSNINDPFFGEILQGIEEVAQNNDYSLFMAASQHDPDREQHIVQTMREHRVDGVIICSASFSTAQSNQFSKYGIPIVVVNNQAAEDYRYSIYHDDIDGSRQLTRHLISLGHRRIAYLGNSSSGRTNLDRLAGFEQEMSASGIAILNEYRFEVPGIDPQHGIDGANYFLKLNQRPTAIVCYNDLIATGVLKGLQSAGIHVPKDISVTGFDNIVFSAFTNPPLTTFDQPKRYIGSEAARLVLELLNTPSQDGSLPEPVVQTLQGKLLIRQSCAAPQKY
ncbi:MAG: LacI family transcriptional regulator [Anaerolineaceae bacterium]|nr:LacI family transcriptional regulator [Anaerolineaceae bacterium]